MGQSRTRSIGIDTHIEQVYGVTIGAISAFSDAFFGLAVLITEYRSIALFWGWETIVFIFWLAVVCIFGPMYAQENPEMDSGIKLMKTSLWIAMAVMVLRLGSCVYATIVVLFSKEVLFEKGRPYLSKRNY